MRSLGPFSSEEPGASNILLAKYTGSCFYQWSTGAIYEGTDGPGHPLVVEEGTAVTYQERRKARKLEPCGWESLTANENGGGMVVAEGGGQGGMNIQADHHGPLVTATRRGETPLMFDLDLPWGRKALCVFHVLAT